MSENSGDSSNDNNNHYKTGNIKDFRNLKKIEKIEDHYKIICKLGEGGFATVSKAQDLITGKYCAIKQMDKNQNEENEKAKEAIVNEL